MKPIQMPALLAALLMGLAGASDIALAAGTGHDHGHAAAAAKPLPPGQRWATDAPLREGMGKVRSALEARLAAVHEDRLGNDEYKSLAELTRQQIAYIVSNCKLKPDADAALHGIIAKMAQGADAMAGKPEATPRSGAMLLAEALDEYGTTFDHPGWKPID